MHNALIQNSFFIYDFILEGDKDFNLTHDRISLCIIKKDYRDLELIKESNLHSKEIIHLSTYAYELKRKSFLLGRITAKRLLAHYTHNTIHPKDIIIKNGLDGEPFIEGNNSNISIAHSNNLGISIVSSPSVKATVDIEYLINFKKIDQQSFNENDFYIFQNVTQYDANIIHAFLWTSKEALVKFLGIGFTVSYHILDVEEIVNYDRDVFIVYFKHFKSIKVLAIREKGVILAICLSKKINLINLNEFILLFRWYINRKRKIRSI